jgi:multidrug transporter EmrE-like cation transporter
MKMQVVALLCLSTVLGIGGQLCLKYAISNYDIDFSNIPQAILALLKNIYIWGWFLLAVAGTYSWMMLLKIMPVNVAFPLSQSFGYVLLLVAAFFLFGEKLKFIQFIGLIVILSGIVLTVI